ncbi:hypothetical protein [Myxosarcina sp. GI1]|uniref:hypothetical protein n=1 Tax=Myxosarcina sp. GI1 TaxID=1541065 RepID=UPI00056945B0|nr:hypothetical protein [Myxosarcina sp. GI1]
MCGIAGIIYRDPQQYYRLGKDLLSAIAPLESRGTDSCGVGVYGKRVEPPKIKLILRIESVVWKELSELLDRWAKINELEKIHAGFRVELELRNNCTIEDLKSQLVKHLPQVHLQSSGQQLEIYKEVSDAASLFAKYNLTEFTGSHGLAHTRMATESMVDNLRAHPFSAAPDMCIVHNGQIANYYKLRFELERKGILFETDNDSEAIANYLRYQLLQGKTLEDSLASVLKDFDGTYTFLVATPDKVGLVRDKYAAKPAAIYESDTMVAIASEHRALLNIPSLDPNGSIREPDAGEINIWSVAANSADFPSQAKVFINR